MKLLISAPWLNLLEERFGIPPATFDRYIFFRKNDKYISIATRDLLVPTSPATESIGFYFLKTSMKQPKLTTQAAMAFGQAATRNVVTVTRSQLEAYLNRESISLTSDQSSACTGRGYVLIRYAGRVYGVGLYVPEEERETVRSLFPKHWAGVQKIALL